VRGAFLLSACRKYTISRLSKDTVNFYESFSEDGSRARAAAAAGPRRDKSTRSLKSSKGHRRVSTVAACCLSFLLFALPHLFFEMTKITQIDDKSAVVAWSSIASNPDYLALGTKVKMKRWISGILRPAAEHC
jgi:hypothetical protein